MIYAVRVEWPDFIDWFAVTAVGPRVAESTVQDLYADGRRPVSVTAVNFECTLAREYRGLAHLGVST